MGVCDAAALAEGVDAPSVGISAAMLGEFSRQQEALLLWLCR